MAFNPFTMALIGGGLSGGLGALGNRSQRRAQERMNRPFLQFQERKNQLVDDLLASLGGEGKFGDLFRSDPEAFQRSFVDPAKAMFQNQIAPQIQQASIAGGTQRGSGLDDQLLRAGVDLDQLLNQQFDAFQSRGQERALSTIQSIFGVSPGQPLQAPPTATQSFTSGIQGFLESPAFANMLVGQGGRGGQTRSTMDLVTRPPREDFRVGFAN